MEISLFTTNQDRIYSCLFCILSLNNHQKCRNFENPTLNLVKYEDKHSKYYLFLKDIKT